VDDWSDGVASTASVAALPTTARGDAALERAPHVSAHGRSPSAGRMLISAHSGVLESTSAGGSRAEDGPNPGHIP
jgi:hypothetical protein